VNFGSVFAALIASHWVGDHIVQSDRDACTKALPGNEGQLACARHVATYTATAAVALTAAALATGDRPRIGRTLAGLAVSAVSHYVIDRRKPVEWLANATGKGRFYQLGQPRPGHDDNPTLGTGAYALDQSAHIGFLFIASLIIAGGDRG